MPEPACKLIIYISKWFFFFHDYILDRKKKTKGREVYFVLRIDSEDIVCYVMKGSHGCSGDSIYSSGNTRQLLLTSQQTRKWRTQSHKQTLTSRPVPQYHLELSHSSLDSTASQNNATSWGPISQTSNHYIKHMESI